LSGPIPKFNTKKIIPIDDDCVGFPSIFPIAPFGKILHKLRIKMKSYEEDDFEVIPIEQLKSLSLCEYIVEEKGS